MTLFAGLFLKVWDDLRFYEEFLPLSKWPYLPIHIWPLASQPSRNNSNSLGEYHSVFIIALSNLFYFNLDDYMIMIMNEYCISEISRSR